MYIFEIKLLLWGTYLTPSSHCFLKISSLELEWCVRRKRYRANPIVTTRNKIINIRLTKKRHVYIIISYFCSSQKRKKLIGKSLAGFNIHILDRILHSDLIAKVAKESTCTTNYEKYNCFLTNSSSTCYYTASDSRLPSNNFLTSLRTVLWFWQVLWRIKSVKVI